MSFQMPPLMIPPAMLPIIAQLQQKYGMPFLNVVPMPMPMPGLSQAQLAQMAALLPLMTSLSPQFSPPTRPSSTASPSAPSSSSSNSTPSPSEAGKAPRTSPTCRCDICGKTFGRHWLLQGHLRTHTGEKPFKCEVCGKAFADKSNLRAHTQTHSGAKPFGCVRCGKRFALRSYLSKHEESSCSRRQSYTGNI